MYLLIFAFVAEKSNPYNLVGYPTAMELWKITVTAYTLLAQCASHGRFINNYSDCFNLHPIFYKALKAFLMAQNSGHLIMVDLMISHYKAQNSGMKAVLPLCILGPSVQMTGGPECVMVTPRYPTRADS